jgi:anion-transporting  ArsA/GET3 family ATPase
VDLDRFLEPKILIVSGKGGVGKTTVSAALALVAARTGRKVCVAEVDRKGTLPKLFGTTRGGTYEAEELSPGVWGLSVIPEDALAEYLRVQYHMRRISKVFTSTHFVDYITTAAPGLKDILVLGKIWYLEQNREGAGFRHAFDTIIVDAPAAGHMLQFLSAPTGLADAVRVGPIQRQAQWLVEMLQDASRTRVHLVSLAEEMPVAETIETAAALNERLGISTGAAFANAILTELLDGDERDALERIRDDPMETLGAQADAVGLDLDKEDIDALLGYERFLEARRAIQAPYVRRLRRDADAPVVELPFLFSAGLALPDIETLADVVEHQVKEL